MSGFLKKIILSLLVLALLAPGAYVVLRPHEIRALGPTFNVEVGSVKWIEEAIKQAGLGAGYSLIRSTMRLAAAEMTKGVFRTLIKGDWGQLSLVTQTPGPEYFFDMANDAAMSAVTGFSYGTEQAILTNKKQDALTKQLEKDTKGLTDKSQETQRKYENFQSELRACKIFYDWYEKYTTCTANLPPMKECQKIIDSSGSNMPEYERCRDEVVAKEQAMENEYEENVSDLAGKQEDLRKGFQGQLENNSKEYVDKQLAFHPDETPLGELGQKIFDTVCDPNPAISAFILLGLSDVRQEKKARTCDIQKLANNWQALTSSTAVLGGVGSFVSDALTGQNISGGMPVSGWQLLQQMVNADTSNFGYAFNLTVGKMTAEDIGLKDAEVNREEEFPIKNLKTLSGQIKTPGVFVGDMFRQAIDKGGSQEEIITGQLVADAVSTFVNTVLGTTMDIVLQGISQFSQGKSKDSLDGNIANDNLHRFGRYQASLYDPDAGPQYGGAEYAEARLAVFDEIELNPGGSLDILTDLQTCPDGGVELGNPNNCTIGAAFANAINERVTVREAMNQFKQGSYGISKTAVFGFFKGGTSINTASSTDIAVEPNYQSHLPYRSLVILRKYRVIPVSWELAALYIRDNPNACEDQNCTLAYLADKFDVKTSPFYHLVDPNWVLKLPPVQCNLYGYGPQVLAQKCPDGTDTCGEDVKIPAARRQVCVDEQTCLQEDKNGKCVDDKFGYCIEEIKTWHFNGTQCEEKWDSCTAFSNAGTGETKYYLKNSTDQSGQCNERNAGCQWYSSARNTGAAREYTSGGVDYEKEWSSASSSQVHFSDLAKDKECPEDAEGCTKFFDGTGADYYYKIAPDYYQCTPGNNRTETRYGVETVTPWYQKEECSPFAVQCEQKYAGCQRYSTQDGGSVAVSGINECNTSCVGLTQYTKQPSYLDTAAQTVSLIESTAQQCLAPYVGCEEFTNLSGESSGAEEKEYFSRLQSCQRKKSDQDTDTNSIFYTVYGSDNGGYRIEKVYLAGAVVSGKNVPSCVQGGQGCFCSKEIAADQDDDSRTRHGVCREYIHAGGNATFAYEYGVVAITDDCRRYRRSADPSQNIFGSPSQSAACAAEFVGCREFHAPQAGNYRVVFTDDFEEKSIVNWLAASSTPATKITTANESLSFANTSLKAENSSAYAFKRVALGLRKGAGYEIEFNAKGSGTVQVKFTDEPDATIIGSATLTGEWQPVRFFAKLGSTPTSDSIEFKTTSAQPLYLDNVRLREMDGVAFLIDKSWTTPDACVVFEANGTTRKIDANGYDTVRPEFYGCKLYTKDGEQNPIAFTTASVACPSEMVGCTSLTKPSEAGAASSTMYIVADAGKQCARAHDRCTAYGLPLMVGGTTIDVDESDSGGKKKRAENWQTRFYTMKKTDPASTPGMCTANDIGCAAFGNNNYFRDPGTKECYWRDATEGETDARKKDGYWAAKVCKKTSSAATVPTIACQSDDDCSTSVPGIAAECVETMCGGGDPAYSAVTQANGWVKACPSEMNSCRKVIDPECSLVAADKTPILRNNYGKGVQNIPCQKEYYLLSDLTDKKEQCNNQVDVEKGCLLFEDTSEIQVLENTYYRYPGSFSTAPIGKPKCSCDKDPVQHDCPENNGNGYAWTGTATDPAQCEEEYNSGGTSTGQKIYVTYHKRTTPFKVGLKYDSSQYYLKNTASSTAVNVGDATIGAAAKDANTLLKVDLDRQCKTWLACRGWVEQDGQKICTGRYPCNKWGPSGECLNYTDLTSDKFKGLLTNTDQNREYLLSLSGVARPDFAFSATSTTVGGHDNSFVWQQQTDGAGFLRLKIDRSAPTEAATDANSIGRACKLYPNQDSLECTTGVNTNVVHGFCLEPYPNADTASTQYARNYWKDEKNEIRWNLASALTIAQKKKYNSSYCLNWYPVDRTESDQINVAGAYDKWYEGPEDLYYCAAKASFAYTIYADQHKDAQQDTVVWRRMQRVYSNYRQTVSDINLANPRNGTEYNGHPNNQTYQVSSLIADVKDGNSAVRTDEFDRRTRATSAFPIDTSRIQGIQYSLTDLRGATFDTVNGDNNPFIIDVDNGTNNEPKQAALLAFSCRVNWTKVGSTEFPSCDTYISSHSQGDRGKMVWGFQGAPDAEAVMNGSELCEKFEVSKPGENWNDKRYRSYVAVKPIMSGNSITGWNYRICDESSDNSTVQDVSNISATGIDLKISITYRDGVVYQITPIQNGNVQYCSDVVKVASTKAAIPVGKQDATNTNLDSIAVTGGSATKVSYTDGASLPPQVESVVASLPASFTGTIIQNIQGVFAKVYGYWKYVMTGPGTVKESEYVNSAPNFTYSLATDEPSRSGWNNYIASQIAGKAPFIKNRGGEDNKFTFIGKSAQDVRVEFYTKAKDMNHLPIRQIKLHWDDGTSAPIVPLTSPEGYGANENPDGANPYAATHLYLGANGSFGSAFGKKIKIVIKDNWGAQYAVCGVVEQGANGTAVINTFTNSTQTGTTCTVSAADF